MNIRMYQCVLPAQYWSTVQPQSHIAMMIQDALVCESQIAKEVNLENASARYHRLCQSIEQEVMLNKGLTRITNTQECRYVYAQDKIPYVELHHEYLAFLYGLVDDTPVGRIGASFVPPQQIAAHREAFQRVAIAKNFADSRDFEQRMMVLVFAQEVGGGIIEVPSDWHLYQAEHDESTRVASPRLNTSSPVTPPPVDINACIQIDAPYLQPYQYQEMQELIRHIGGQIGQNQPATFGSTANHVQITEALRRMSYQVGATVQPVSLRVMYVDGSEANPFPLFSLSQPCDHAQIATPLKVALMSIRHMELDTEIDYCWFRNRDVSRSRTLAETDAYCYRVSREQLQDALRDGDVILHLYHTGFEPAVIGFYRAVVDTLHQLRREQSAKKIHITPIYFRKNQAFVEGMPWY
jgi:hypothetical protein